MTAQDFQWDVLFRGPDNYLLEFNGRQALFIPMTRESYHKSIFTDRQRIVPAQAAGNVIAMEPLLQHSESSLRQRPLRFIFHMAHGGSTLLSRAMDFPGRSLVIREPSPLRQLAGERLAADDLLFGEADWKRRLLLVTGLLGRRFEEAEPVIVKANVPVNFILSHVLSAHADSCGVILYSGLQEYLAAVLKSADHQRWVLNVARQLQSGIGEIERLSSVVVDNLSAPQAAACLWVSQMSSFHRALGEFTNLGTVQSGTFFEQPAATLGAMAVFMGIDLSADETDRIAGSGLFSGHAKKSGVAYDNAARKADFQRQLRDNRQMIDEGMAWAEDYLSAIPEVLPRPLLA